MLEIASLGPQRPSKGAEIWSGEVCEHWGGQGRTQILCGCCGRETSHRTAGRAGRVLRQRAREEVWVLQGEAYVG